jgi:hypothetical protein
VWPPPHAYAEVHALAQQALPGVRYRRHLLWRYSLIWAKPTPKVMAPNSLGQQSSNASSNADAQARTDADDLDHDGADHLKVRTESDGSHTG